MFCSVVLLVFGFSLVVFCLWLFDVILWCRCLCYFVCFSRVVCFFSVCVFRVYSFCGACFCVAVFVCVCVSFGLGISVLFFGFLFSFFVRCGFRCFFNVCVWCGDMVVVVLVCVDALLFFGYVFV